MSEENFVPPKAPSDLCFNETNFVQVIHRFVINFFLILQLHLFFNFFILLLKKIFDVDAFLKEHRKNVSLEKMRDDLGVYLKILRSAMIELINKDYADFVNLSSDLIGLDKAINNLETPLGQLKEEVLVNKYQLL